MKFFRLFILTALCFSLTSCSLLYMKESSVEAPKPGISVAVPQKEPLTPPTDTIEKTPLRISFMDAFKADIEQVIRQYGRYEQESDYGMVKGLKYGALVDFEKDGTPELVLLHDLTVKVYRFDGENSFLIYEKALGGRFGQTDVSHTFAINEKSATPCLITYQTNSEWWSEGFAVLTVQNGRAYEQMLEADAYLPGKNTDAPCDEFHTFLINGQEVNETEYNTAKNKALTGKKEIDACYGEGYGADIKASEAELNTFLHQFKL